MFSPLNELTSQWSDRVTAWMYWNPRRLWCFTKKKVEIFKSLYNDSLLPFWTDWQKILTENFRKLTRVRETPAETPLLSSTLWRCRPAPQPSHNAHGSNSPARWWRPDDQNYTEFIKTSKTSGEKLQQNNSNTNICNSKISFWSILLKDNYMFFFNTGQHST